MVALSMITKHPLDRTRIGARANIQDFIAGRRIQRRIPTHIRAIGVNASAHSLRYFELIKMLVAWTVRRFVAVANKRWIGRPKAARVSALRANRLLDPAKLLQGSTDAT